MEIGVAWSLFLLYPLSVVKVFKGFHFQEGIAGSASFQFHFQRGIAGYPSFLFCYQWGIAGSASFWFRFHKAIAESSFFWFRFWWPEIWLGFRIPFWTFWIAIPVHSPALPRLWFPCTFSFFYTLNYLIFTSRIFILHNLSCASWNSFPRDLILVGVRKSRAGRVCWSVKQALNDVPCVPLTCLHI